MNHRGRRTRRLLNTGSFSGPIAIFGVALAEYVDRVLRKAVRQLVIARFSTAAISQAKRISFTVTRQKASALAGSDMLSHRAAIGVVRCRSIMS